MKESATYSQEIKHVNRALPTEGHSPMYNMHKYFARKQEDVISEYIGTYSQKGEVILDPFCGSGVMFSESLKLGRRAIAIDVNPVSTFITRNSITYVDTNEIGQEFENIKQKIKEIIDSLYQTRCRKCDSVIPAICFTWNDGVLIDVRYECPTHGRNISTVDEYDKELLNKVESEIFKNYMNGRGEDKLYFPTNKLYYSDGRPFKEKQHFESVDELFTKRNLLALSILLKDIEKIENAKLRNAFRFAFSSMTHLASRMCLVRPSRPYSSAWTQQSYWFAKHNMESNVWGLFESAINGRQGLVKAKNDIPNSVRNLRIADKEKYIENNRIDGIVLNKSALDTLKNIKENSIDYVITDPPYAGSIQYGELLFMWGNWLRLFDDLDTMFQNEIIVNDKRNKGEEEYFGTLYAVFREVFRVLKPGKYCHITFHNPELKYRNMLFKALVMSGFEFEKIIYQPPPRASFKSLRQPFGSLEGDYFFRFKKGRIEEETKSLASKSTDRARVESLIVSIAEEIIAERGEPTPYTFIQNSIDPILYEELKKYGLVLDYTPDTVEKTLKKYIGTTFQVVDVTTNISDEEEKKQQKLLERRWWFVDPSKHRLDIPLNKRVEEAIVNLLRKQITVTFTEVLTEVYTRFQNSLTPDEQSITEILKENAITYAEGKWKIKSFVGTVSAMHEKICYYLADLGIKSGYDVEIASDEYWKLFNRKRLDQLLKLTPLDIKDAWTKDRVSKIDVIWHKSSDIFAEFEVEHSTQIVDAIIRGANIKSENVVRVIAVPSEREYLVSRKFKEPGIKTIMKEADWSIVTYKNIESVYNEYESKRKMDSNELLKYLRKPIDKEEDLQRRQKKLF